MNSYEWPTPDPAPKHNRHVGLDKSYEFVRVRSYELVRISHFWITRTNSSWDRVGYLYVLTHLLL